MTKYTLIIGLFLAVNFGCSSSENNDKIITPGEGQGQENEEGDNETEEPVEVTWITLDVPANAGDGMEWVFQTDVSDNFEYEAPAANKGANFLSKWDDFYHNAWTGPAPTVWKRDHSLVTNNKLEIIASRPSGTTTTNAGIITSKKRVVYPVYIEARAKTMNSTLANGIWLLSPDDTQEIDIAEAYSGSRWDNDWFAPDRMHLSHHVFIRDPFQDWQPHDEGSFYTDGSTIWNEDYHTYGVYWKDPWNLEYYIDGKLVRTRSGVSQIDPSDFTNGTGLSKEMDIIIDAEDQTWRANNGLSPTNEELANSENHTFKIDWIRVFKPIQQ